MPAREVSPSRTVYPTYRNGERSWAGVIVRGIASCSSIVLIVHWGRGYVAELKTQCVTSLTGRSPNGQGYGCVSDCMVGAIREDGVAVRSVVESIPILVEQLEMNIGTRVGPRHLSADGVIRGHSDTVPIVFVGVLVHVSVV